MTRLLRYPLARTNINIYIFNRLSSKGDIMFGKKGMIYGGYVWAFLIGIILAFVIIAALHYYNVIDIGAMLPQQVSITPAAS